MPNKWRKLWIWFLKCQKWQRASLIEIILCQMYLCRALLPLLLWLLFPKWDQVVSEGQASVCNNMEIVTTSATRLDVFDNVQGEEHFSFALADNIVKIMLYQVHAVFSRLQSQICLCVLILFSPHHEGLNSSQPLFCVSLKENNCKE